MSKPNKTRYALLGVLGIRPASGYDIKKFCDRSIAHFWNENYGHIYPVLRELEAEGLIAGERRETEGRPPRTLYAITEKGREELRAWLARPVEPAPARHELLLKLVFAGNIPAERTVEMLEEAKERYETHLREYARLESEYGSAPEGCEGGRAYWLAALRYGRMDAEFRARWCGETIELIKNGKVDG
jgi:PadR family transcriptional regulator AphA